MNSFNCMRKIIIRFIVSFIVVAFTVLFALSIVNYSYFQERVSEQLSAYGILALFIFTILFDLAPLVFSPHLAMLSAYLIGIPIILIILVTLIGSTLGSALGYAIGRYYGPNILIGLVKPEQYKKTRIAFNKQARLFVFLCAVTPLPFIPLAYGVLQMSKGSFFWFGLLPRMINIISAGIFLYIIL